MKDSGNDLIAFIGGCFKSIQVKTKQEGRGWSVPKNRKYEILALVDLDETLYLDKSKIWLFTKQEAEKKEHPLKMGRLKRYTCFQKKELKNWLVKNQLRLDNVYA